MRAKESSPDREFYPGILHSRIRRVIRPDYSRMSLKQAHDRADLYARKILEEFLIWEML